MEEKKAFTHGVIFHADDVFAAALLLLLNPRMKIERGNQVPEHYDGIVFDIGLGKYDHHQFDKRIRENGVPYAAFGLLWDEYGELFLEAEDAKKFDEDFVQPLDWTDNTGEKNLLSSYIANLNPLWNEESADGTEQFFSAVEFARQVLNRKFEVIRAKREAYREIEKILKKNGISKILVLDKAMPWKDAVKGKDIVYVIFPSARDGYMIQAVSSDEKNLKKPFPERWCGKTEQELKNITGIKTFRFCHSGGYLCVADTLEDAGKIAEIALDSEWVEKSRESNDE